MRMNIVEDFLLQLMPLACSELPRLYNLGTTPISISLDTIVNISSC